MRNIEHIIQYNEETGEWFYEDTKEVIPEPESWYSRCSGDGHTTYIDENGDRRYTDNGEIKDNFRPCARCGKYPTIDGHDFCLQTLGSVMNACCGHGKHEGYIQFDNGVTIRGSFRVEYDG